MSNSSTATTVSLLQRIEQELREQLSQWPQTLRHAFYIRAGRTFGCDLPQEIENFLWWLRCRDGGDDRCEDAFFSEAPFLASTDTAELWELFIASTEAPKESRRRCLDVLEKLNLVVTSGKLAFAFPELAGLERWTQLVHCLAKQDPELIGCKPEGLSFDFDNAMPGKPVLASHNDWQSNLPPGRHFFWLDRDARRCWIDVIHQIEFLATPRVNGEVNRPIVQRNNFQNVLVVVSPNEAEENSPAPVAQPAAKPEPAAETQPTNRKPSVSADEANVKAREALKGKPTGGGRWTDRKLANAIDCSCGLANRLPAWRSHPDNQGSAAPESQSTPRRSPLPLTTVALVKPDERADDPGELASAKELADLAGDNEVELKRLIDEQGKDQKSCRVGAETPHKQNSSR